MLIGWHIEALGQPLGYLLGGPPLARLDLDNSLKRTAHPPRQIPLRQVECPAPLLEPYPERIAFLHSTGTVLLTVVRRPSFLQLYALFARVLGCTMFCTTICTIVGTT